MSANTAIPKLRKVVHNLSEFEKNLHDWEQSCLNGDNHYHFVEIRTHIGRIKYHIDKVDVLKSKREQELHVQENMAEMVVKKSEISAMKLVDIPGEIVDEKVRKERFNVNFRDKKTRKAPSWKYLDKWITILDEEWSQCREDSADDYRGVNIVPPKRVQQYRGNAKKKFNSTECILDEDIDIKFETSNKRFASEGNLLDDLVSLSTYDPNGETAENTLKCDYLLSLRDLQSFEQLGNHNGTLSIRDSCGSDIYNNDHDNHKPRIVGVIYKDRL